MTEAYPILISIQCSEYVDEIDHVNSALCGLKPTAYCVPLETHNRRLKIQNKLRVSNAHRIINAFKKIFGIKYVIAK